MQQRTILYIPFHFVFSIYFSAIVIKITQLIEILENSMHYCQSMSERRSFERRSERRSFFRERKVKIFPISKFYEIALNFQF